MIKKCLAVYMFVLAGVGLAFPGCSSGGSSEIQTTATSSNLSPQEKVFKAAGTGDLATLKSVLAADGSLANARGFNGMTPLHSAAMDGQTAAVKLLLENGADPTLVNDDSATPANTAMAEGHKDTAKLLDEALAKRSAEPAQ